MPSTHLTSNFHLVFSTKERRRIIINEWRPRLHSYLGGIVKGMDAIPLAVGGVRIMFIYSSASDLNIVSTISCGI